VCHGLVEHAMPLGPEGVRQEWRAGDVRQRRRGGGCGQATGDEGVGRPADVVGGC